MVWRILSENDSKMIINTSTIILSFLILGIFAYFGLQVIRKFALQIAIEEHQNLIAMDSEAEANRKKQEKIAEEAEKSAMQKVKAADIRQV